jgi:hypothetical protein
MEDSIRSGRGLRTGDFRIRQGLRSGQLVRLVAEGLGAHFEFHNCLDLVAEAIG